MYCTPGTHFPIVASPDNNSMADWLPQKHTQYSSAMNRDHHCQSALRHSCDMAETSVLVRNGNHNRNNSL